MTHDKQHPPDSKDKDVIAIQPTPDATVRPVPVKPLKESPRRSPLRVLIVDDEEPVRKFVERVLRDAGYETVIVADGAEAIAAAQHQGPFDVVVTDVMMPQMAGDELARRLRQNEPELKVLYLTGYSDRLFKEKVTLWAGEAFLDKPCSVKGLKEAVSLLFFGQIDAPKT